jgi:hypothetical protein
VGGIFTCEPLHGESLARQATTQTDGRFLGEYCMMTASSQTDVRHLTHANVIDPKQLMSQVPFRKVKSHVLMEQPPVTLLIG